MVKIEFLEDKLVYDYGRLRRIYGEPDADGSVEVLYKDIPNIPPEPDFEDDREENQYSRLEPVYVEKINKTIVFYINYHIERMAESPEEYLVGPFLTRE